MTVTITLPKGSPLKVSRIIGNRVAIQSDGQTFTLNKAGFISLCNALIDLVEEETP